MANASESTTSSEESRRLFSLLSLIVIGIAACLRFAAIRDNFWLDEIWSWKLALHAKSYWQIAAKMPIDNNHVLNTWIIYTLPPDSPWIIYRIPAALAGIMSVVMAGLCARHRGRAESLIVMLLTGFSFVLIQYSSEARGYAYLVLFVWLCLWFMQQAMSRRRSRAEIGFAICACLGFLAHLSFVVAYTGLFLWSIISVGLREERWSYRLASWFRLHFLPVLLLAGLALVNINGMIGGGNQTEAVPVILQAGSLIVGGPDRGPVAMICFGASVVGCLMGIVLLARRRDGIAVFCGVSIGAIAIVFLVMKPGVVYVRYFLVPIVCALILLSHLLARLWEWNRTGKTLSSLLIVAILAGNTMRTSPLLTIGRGDYQSAVAFMLSHTSASEVTIASDHDFRNPLVLEYYLRRSGSSKQVTYFAQGRGPERGTDWVILHSFDEDVEPDLEIGDARGNTYRLVQVYPHAGLSGWTWLLYQREDVTD